MYRARLRHAVRLLTLLWLSASAACSDSESGAPTSPDPRSTPVVGVTLSATIDSLGSSVALPGVSNVQLSVVVPPEATVLTCAIDFGDGTRSSAQTSSHIYQSAGTYTVNADVTLRSGQLLHASTSVTARALTGTWFQGSFNPRTGRFEVRRFAVDAQDGRAVQVRWQSPGVVSLQAASGEIQDERRLVISADGGAVRLEGTIPSHVIASNETLDMRVVSNPDGALNGSTLAFQTAATASSPAPAAGLSVQIDHVGSPAAIMAVSPVTFTVTGSIDMSAIYAIEFGDGEHAVASDVVHPCLRNGYLTARLTVLDASGRSAVATRDYGCFSLVTGTNSAGFVNVRYPTPATVQQRWLYLTAQNGSLIEGDYRHPEQNLSHFHGRVISDRHIEMVLDDGTITFSGDVLLNLNFPGSHLRLLVRGGSADGATLDFGYWDPY